MRTIVYLDEDGATSAEQLYDDDVIGLPITISYTLMNVWRHVSPGSFQIQFNFSPYSDDKWFHWAMESQANYEELWNYGMDILEEYDHRFGSRVQHPYKHGSTPAMNKLGAVPPLPDLPRSPFPVSVEEARSLYSEWFHKPIVFKPEFSFRERPAWLK
jgi:hypothetical protein